ncbi:hypothetical protein AG1IA_04207 [Rhizoctonia solani AG-1 IA]|uniref:Uncharacterized protein n=1 Tax=Thanatephorus cucumeris (strain AG1-IA) TaxID=983506 RepID=L8WYD7_THACA|nr:hypothetical protein AG1IA_04207 [Rhizoctonia solani AG-1 IA]
MRARLRNAMVLVYGTMRGCRESEGDGGVGGPVGGIRGVWDRQGREIEEKGVEWERGGTHKV